MSPRVGLDTQAVIEAAMALVDELGVEQLSLALLAQRLNVRKPSLYNHITSLSALKYQVALQSKREILARLTRTIEEKSGTEALFALVETYRAFAQEHPGLYTLSEQFHATENDLEFLAVEQASFTRIGTVMAPYQLNDKEVNTAILGVRGIIKGFLALEMGGDVSSHFDIDHAFHWTIKVFLKGLLQEKPGPNVTF